MSAFSDWRLLSFLSPIATDLIHSHPLMMRTKIVSRELLKLIQFLAGDFLLQASTATDQK